MRTFFRKMLSAALAGAMLSSSLSVAASEALGRDLAARQTDIAAGTQLSAATYWSDSNSDLRQEYYITYHPGGKVIPVVTYGPTTRSLTTLADAAAQLEAQGLRVVAGINGDYYGTLHGVPLGTTVVLGELRNGNHDPYQAVGFRADGTAIIGSPRLTMQLSSNGEVLSEVFAFNHVRQSTYGIFLYDDRFDAEHSTGVNEPGVDVICSVEEGKLAPGQRLRLHVDSVRNDVSDTTVPAGKLVLTANLKAETAASILQRIQEGDELELNVYFARSGSDPAPDEEWNQVVNMIGAPIRLVENGMVSAGLTAGNAPRTAIGQKADGTLVFYTIDGRQSGYSIGGSLTAVAARLIELGCVSAVALDGGGSTTLSATMPNVKQSAVVNTPSEGVGRAVSNHIFLVQSSQPSGTADHIYLSPDAVLVLPGAKVPLTASVVDSNYIPMEGELTFAADRGTVDGNVLTAPDTTGSLRVVASSGELTASADVNVAVPDSIELLQNGKAVSAVALTPGASVTLTARATYDHLEVEGGENCFAWDYSGDGVTVSDTGILTAGQDAAAGKLTVSAAGKAATVPVNVVVRPLLTLVDFEDLYEPITDLTAESPEDAVPALTLSRAEDALHVRFGKSAAKVDYRLPENGSAELPMFYPLMEGYNCIELWAHGNGGNVSMTLTTDAGDSDTAPIRHNGWAPLAFRLPEGATTLTGIRVSATEAAEGRLWMDQLVLAYDYLVDAAAPDVSLRYDETTNRVTGHAFDAVCGGTLSALALRYDGESVPYTYDSNSGELTAALPEPDGQAHRVTLVAGDGGGNLARQSVDIPASADAEPAFPDTDGHWGDGSIGYLKRTGISGGDDKGLYHPDASITRQEFAAMLYRYLSPAEDYSDVELTFADTERIADWAKPAAKAMYALGIIGGTKGDKGMMFHPLNNISRQEAVTMLYRLMEKGYAVPEMTYSDANEIPQWSSEAIATLGGMGVFDEFVDDAFRPQEPITRAQVASILFRLN